MGKDRSKFVPGRREVIYLSVLVVLLLGVLALIMLFSGAKDSDGAGKRARAWTAPVETSPGDNPPGFEKVRDNDRKVVKPYFNLLKRAATDAILKDPLCSCGFANLATAPGKYRGRLLEVSGRVLTVAPHLLERGDSAELESSGARIDDTPSMAYQTEIVVEDEGGAIIEKYFLHTKDFPEGLTPGDMIVFRGFFYSLFPGKILNLRVEEGEEEKTAVVVAPLLVGREIVRKDGAAAKRPEAPVNLSSFKINDSDADIAEDAAAAAAGALRALSSERRAEACETPVPYFDMLCRPGAQRGGAVRIEGEVLKIEMCGWKEDYRKAIFAVKRYDIFQHYYVVVLAPSAAKAEAGDNIALTGIFTELLKVKGATTATTKMPVVVAIDFEGIDAPQRDDPTTYYGFIAMIIFLIVLGASVVLFVISRLRRVS